MSPMLNLKGARGVLFHAVEFYVNTFHIQLIPS